MLNVIGESPVSSATSNHPSALSAAVTLNKLTKELQNRGWWFNKEYALNLLPEVSTGHILIPQGALDIDPNHPYSNLVQRGNRLYDPVNHTYNIGEAVRVDVVLELTIEELPEIAAAFLKAKAAYDFYVNDDGDETKSTRLEKEVARTWASLQQAEMQNSDINSRNRPVSALLRSRIRQIGGSYNPMWPGGR